MGSHGQTAHKSKKAKPASAKTPVAAMEIPENYLSRLKDAEQAIVVTTPGWNAVDGSLQRFEKRDGAWHPVGDKWAIVVGKSGLGWDALTEAAPSGAPVKKEGDGRSPAGVFTIGEAFGYADSSDVKLPYRPLTESIECVDDASSQSYNQVVDRKDYANPDWNSSEKMRSVDVYKEGLVVNYNADHVPDAGSCIFMHIWKGAGHGTAGCTAMDEDKLTEMMHWLDEKKKPVLVQLPEAMYKDVKDKWGLP